MRKLVPPLIILPFLLASQSVFAYGSGGGGGSSCTEPQFTSESPKNDTSVTKLEAFTVEASKNTDLKTLQLEIDGVRQDPKVTTLLTGDYRLEVSLKEPKTLSSKVRITLRAKSDEGCEAFQPYYIQIQP